MKQIGYNVHPHGMPAGDQARLDRAVDEAGSTVCLVLNDAAAAHRFKVRHAGSEVILRLMPEWGGSDDWMTPDQAGAHADYYRRSLNDLRIIAHGQNEPQPPFGEAAVQFALNFGRACVEYGLRAVLLNISVGTLPAAEVHRLRPVIELVNAHPGQLFIGFHAYTPPDWRKWREWLIGNFLYIHAYCDAEGLERPGLIFTEFGYDTHWDREVGNWNIVQAIEVLGQVGAARNLIEAWSGTMDGLDNVLGVCLFCAGGYGTMWEPFNALDARWSAFWDTLYKEWPEQTQKGGRPELPDVIRKDAPNWWIWLVGVLRKLGLDI